MLKAVLRQFQPQFPRDIAHKHGGIRLHAALDLVQTMRFGDEHSNLMTLFHRIDLAKHRRLVLVLGANHDTLPCGIKQIIEHVAPKYKSAAAAHCTTIVTAMGATLSSCFAVSERIK